MPTFDEIQELAQRVAQTTSAQPELQLETYQESSQENYEEPYFFGFRSRTRTRLHTETKTRETRRWWTLGLLYRHVESAHERQRPNSGYRYEDERWLVLDGEGTLTVYVHGTSVAPSFRDASSDDIAELDRDTKTRSSSKRNHNMQEEWVEMTRGGPYLHNERFAGAREALQRLQN